MTGQQGFCRDCLAIQSLPSPLGPSPGNHNLHKHNNARIEPENRCNMCGSPRLVRHDELFELQIAHIDCDAFYASVEKRDNPELSDRPVIVGGGKRGVVSTCCYIARINGVRSAMPMYKALQVCPDAVVIKPRMDVYSRVGKEIRNLMRALTPAVEPLSIDEAFLDLSGTERLHKNPPALTLAKFARRIETEIGISVSVGLAANKFLAKVASDFEKPRGFSVIGQAEAFDFLAEQPVSLIWGVGKAMQKKLYADNIYKISDLQKQDENELIRRYGSMGLRLARLSRGEDHRTIQPHSKAKSVSTETTFIADRATTEQLVPVLRKLAEKVSERLKTGHIAGQTVILKLKSANFSSRTRNTTLPDPTQLADRIFSVGRTMLEKEIDGTRFRLLGIGVSDLQSDETADPEDLIDETSSRRAAAERAIDKVRDKFGGSAVEYGLTFKAPPKPPPKKPPDGQAGKKAGKP